MGVFAFSEDDLRLLAEFLAKTIYLPITDIEHRKEILSNILQFLEAEAKENFTERLGKNWNDDTD